MVTCEVCLAVIDEVSLGVRQVEVVAVLYGRGGTAGQADVRTIVSKGQKKTGSRTYFSLGTIEKFRPEPDQKCDRDLLLDH